MLEQVFKNPPPNSVLGLKFEQVTGYVGAWGIDALVTCSDHMWPLLLVRERFKARWECSRLNMQWICNLIISYLELWWIKKLKHTVSYDRMAKNARIEKISEQFYHHSYPLSHWVKVRERHRKTKSILAAFPRNPISNSGPENARKAHASVGWLGYKALTCISSRCLVRRGMTNLLVLYGLVIFVSDFILRSLELF